jgi:hypothetical protein
MLPLLIFIHVAASIIAAFAGAVTVADMLRGRDPGGWATLFIATALFTSVSGFVFPITQPTPAQAVGVAALLTFAVVLPARYRYRLAGRWRAVYAGGLVVSLYWLAFVFIAEAFLRVPRIGAYAPTLNEPPFVVAQAIALVVFAPLCWLVVRSYRPAAATA